jgi:high-affinity Fe2+/Pb2+ permease
MKKNPTIILIVSMVAILVIGVVLILLLQNTAANRKVSNIESQIKETQTKLDKLKVSKDSNNYTPTEVVKGFIIEVKAGSSDNSKLYLSKSVQNMDIKNTLKLGNDVINVEAGESEEVVDVDSATVTMEFVLSEDTVVRDFQIIKEDGAWKINGVVAQ